MTEDQIAKTLSTYESTIRRQAAEKKQLELQLVKAHAALNEIFRYSHERHIVDTARKAKEALGSFVGNEGTS